MQLLVLKILYLLFTTKGTSEYFYTNDLCVLVDVFLRELVDLDEDSESVRWRYFAPLLLTLTTVYIAPPYISSRLASFAYQDTIAGYALQTCPDCSRS